MVSFCLELDEIFKINPTVKVTGVDLAKDMLEKIKQKYSDKFLFTQNNYAFINSVSYGKDYLVINDFEG